MKPKGPQLLKKPKLATVHLDSVCKNCKSDYCLIKLDEDFVIPCANLKEYK